MRRASKSNDTVVLRTLKNYLYPRNAARLASTSQAARLEISNYINPFALVNRQYLYGQTNAGAIEARQALIKWLDRFQGAIDTVINQIEGLSLHLRVESLKSLLRYALSQKRMSIITLNVWEALSSRQRFFNYEIQCQENIHATVFTVTLQGVINEGSVWGRCFIHVGDLFLLRGSKDDVLQNKFPKLPDWNNTLNNFNNPHDMASNSSNSNINNSNRNNNKLPNANERRRNRNSNRIHETILSKYDLISDLIYDSKYKLQKNKLWSKSFEFGADVVLIRPSNTLRVTDIGFILRTLTLFDDAHWKKVYFGYERYPFEILDKYIDAFDAKKAMTNYAEQILSEPDTDYRRFRSIPDRIRKRGFYRYISDGRFYRVFNPKDSDGDLVYEDYSSEFPVIDSMRIYSRKILSPNRYVGEGYEVYAFYVDLQELKISLSFPAKRLRIYPHIIEDNPMVPFACVEDIEISSKPENKENWFRDLLRFLILFKKYFQKYPFSRKTTPYPKYQTTSEVPFFIKALIHYINQLPMR
jgi:hypothetical protein